MEFHQNWLQDLMQDLAIEMKKLDAFPPEQVAEVQRMLDHLMK